MILQAQLPNFLKPGTAKAWHRYEVPKARELLATLGVERYDLRVKDLAEYLNKHPPTVTGWVMRGVRRRAENPGTVAQTEAVDRNLCDRSGRED